MREDRRPTRAQARFSKRTANRRFALFGITDVLTNIDGVLRRFNRAMTTTPPLNPSPQGEGNRQRSWHRTSMPDLCRTVLRGIPAACRSARADDLKKLVTMGWCGPGSLRGGQAVRDAAPPRGLRGKACRPPARPERGEGKGRASALAGRRHQGFPEGDGACLDLMAKTRRTPRRGDFYVAVIEKKGPAAIEVIARSCGRDQDFPWPKSMRWGQWAAHLGASAAFHRGDLRAGDRGKARYRAFRLDGIEAGTGRGPSLPSRRAVPGEAVRGCGQASPRPKSCSIRSAAGMILPLPPRFSPSRRGTELVRMAACWQRLPAWSMAGSCPWAPSTRPFLSTARGDRHTSAQPEMASCCATRRCASWEQVHPGSPTPRPKTAGKATPGNERVISGARLSTRSSSTGKRF